MMNGGWFAHGAGVVEKRKVSGSDVGVGRVSEYSRIYAGPASIHRSRFLTECMLYRNPVTLTQHTYYSAPLPISDSRDRHASLW
jgi:hypothetical protein